MKLKKFLTTILLVAMIVTIIAGSTVIAAQKVDPNNDDLVGEGLGPDLGFGPIGVDIDTLVERMGDKIHDIKISLQMVQSFSPWAHLWYETMQKLGDNYGIDMILFDVMATGSTVEAQQMDSAVNMGVDGIILYYVDPIAAIPATNKAIDEGVYVVPTFAQPGSKATISRAGSDVEIGEAVAKKALKDFAGQKITVTLANLCRKYGILDERMEGFEKVLSTDPNVTLLKDSYILEEEDPQAFFNGAFDVLSRHEELDLILCSYGLPTVDVAMAIKKAGRKVAIYGVDIDEAMCQKIKNGEITGTQPYDARVNAYMSLFTMLRLINGDKNVPSWEDPYKNLIVTKENVDKYAWVSYGIKLE